LKFSLILFSKPGANWLVEITSKKTLKLHQIFIQFALQLIQIPVDFKVIFYTFRCLLSQR